MKKALLAMALMAAAIGYLIYVNRGQMKVIEKQRIQLELQKRYWETLGYGVSIKAYESGFNGQEFSNISSILVKTFPDVRATIKVKDDRSH